MSTMISSDAASAFNRAEKFRRGNTEVRVDEGVVQMLLHGNMIAQKTKLAYTISTCGWNTLTTRSRLNGLHRVNVYQSKGQLYLNNVAWDGENISIHGY